MWEDNLGNVMHILGEASHTLTFSYYMLYIAMHLVLILDWGIPPVFPSA